MCDDLLEMHGSRLRFWSSDASALIEINQSMGQTLLQVTFCVSEPVLHHRTGLVFVALQAGSKLVFLV